MRRLAALAVAALLLTGCAPAAPTPTTLTTELAERLAVTRFRNFDAGVRTIDVTVPGTGSGEVELTGWFDYAASVGYGSVTADGQPAGLLWWSADTIAVREGEFAEPLPAPTDGWVSSGLDASSTALATAVTIVLSLGSDRPENPQLLQQSDAEFEKSSTVDGVPVDVVLGPSSDDVSAASVASAHRARYWLDKTGVMLRFEVTLGNSATPMTIDFGDGAGTAIPQEVPGT